MCLRRTLQTSWPEVPSDPGLQIPRTGPGKPPLNGATEELNPEFWDHWASVPSSRKRPAETESLSCLVGLLVRGGSELTVHSLQ